MSVTKSTPVVPKATAEAAETAKAAEETTAAALEATIRLYRLAMATSFA